MTEYLDIVEEVDDYRVRLEIDDAPEKPEDDCACAVLQVGRSWRDYETVNAFNEQAEGFETKYRELAERVGFDVALDDAFERYLRIFHGTTSFIVKDSENYRYIGFDTPAWREKTGCTPEHCKKAGLDEEKLAEGTVEEVVAWANGEVYGHIVEKKVRWEKTYPDEENFDDEEGFDWVEVEDSICWGLYGRDWAEQAAREALEEARADYHDMTWYIGEETATARVDWRRLEEWLVAERDCKDRYDMSNEDFKAFFEEFKLTYRVGEQFRFAVEPDEDWQDVEEAR